MDKVAPETRARIISAVRSKGNKSTEWPSPDIVENQIRVRIKNQYIAQQPRQFSKEFKLGAINLSNQAGMTVNKVAEDLGISRTILTLWLEKHQSQVGAPFRGNGKRSAAAGD